MQLHNYFRSSASFRVRIALNLKSLSFDYLPVHLTRDGGEQFAPAYRTLCPEALVPLFVNGDVSLHQSLAIIEYLDEVHPQPALLPADPLGRATVRAMALDIACDIHPLNNLRVLKYLGETVGLQKEERDAWYRHWVETGFAALETRLAQSRSTGRFCYGDTPSLADITLVPQVFNAQRFDVDLSAYPEIARITHNCWQLAAFADAAPERQPDAQ